MGKIEFVDKLIKDLTDKLFALDKENPVEKQNSYKEDNNLSKVLTESSRQLEKLGIEKQNLFNEISELKSKNLLQEELINRFLLLKEHYNSDIKRLEFITEGEEFFHN